MAEFRHERYKEWPTDRGELKPYNPEKIREKLKDLLVNGEDEMRLALAAQLSSLPERAKDENDSPPPERSSEKLKIEPQGPRPHP